MPGQLRESQMRHPPADSSFLVVARDQQFGFVCVARLFPNPFAVWIAPGEHLVDGIERRYRVVRIPIGEASGEAIRAGCRVVENGGFGKAFGPD